MERITLEDISIGVYDDDIIEIHFRGPAGSNYIGVYKCDIPRITSRTLYKCTENSQDLLIITEELIMVVLEGEVYLCETTPEEFQLTLNTQLILGANNV